MYTVEGFCQAMALNEALFGQRRESLELLVKELGVELELECRDLYLCLTGLPRETYRGRVPMTRPRYQQILHPLVDELLEQAEEGGLWARYTVVHYDGSKQICFFLRENGETRLGVWAFAEEAARRFEAEYRKLEGYRSSGLANFTVISGRIPDYDRLSEAFLGLQELRERAFFRMEAGVFDEEMLKGMRRELGGLYGGIGRIEELLYEGGKEELGRQVRELFLEEIKGSLDKELCQSAVYELNRMAFRVEELFGTEGEFWRRLWMEDYSCIEQMESAAERGLLELEERIRAAQFQGKNPLTLRAVRWLRKNCGGDVGLQETAEHLGVSPAYLSRVFSRDMGETLSAFLLKLRMERAKRLLAESDMKIGQVARQSGFRDPEYFGALFKRTVGLQPRKYREREMKNR